MKNKVMLSALLALSVVGVKAAESDDKVQSSSVLEHPAVQTSLQVGGSLVRYAAAGAVVVLANNLLRQGGAHVPGVNSALSGVDNVLGRVEGASAGLVLGATLLAKQLVVDPAANRLGLPEVK